MARAPKPLDHRSFLRGIAKHPLAPVYLLLGNEPFFRHRVVDALRRRILGPDAPAADVRTFTGKRKGGDAATELSAVLDAARTMAMFDPVRLIHVEEAGALLGKEAGEVQKALEEKAREKLGETGSEAVKGAGDSFKKLLGK